jgi:hypothetical protein
MSGIRQPGGPVFRASPAWDLVEWDRLGADERALLGELAQDPGFYGILRPLSGNGRSLRGVDRDTALLFLTLRQPGPLPRFAMSDGGGAAADLVTDGILEVSDGTVFRSGGAGAALLQQGTVAEPGHRLGRLSLGALRYAAALRLEDAHVLAARLYHYNRMPLTPEWAARAPDARSVVRFLELRGSGPWQPATSVGGAWIQWTRRVAAAGGPPTHKLYVSPVATALPALFPILLETLERAPVAQFKLGGDAAGLLRPDKLVAYFTDAGALAETADALARRLAGTPAHGVPFTAPIDVDGLLSWGMDPPPESRPLAWLPGESWRSWLVRELASGLIGGSDGPAPVGPALERLRRRGVDVDRWVPASTLWREVEV